MRCASARGCSAALCAAAGAFGCLPAALLAPLIPVRAAPSPHSSSAPQTSAPRSTSRKSRSDKATESGRSTSAAPHLSHSATNAAPSANTIPIMPPAENVPLQGATTVRVDSAVEMLSKSKPAPSILMRGSVDLFGPNPLPGQHPQQQRDGERAEPQQLQKRSEVYDPARPVRLWARADPATEFQDGSCG